MDEITAPEAKSASAGVRPIPFGMPALDATLGGLPSGTAALLAGASDAGGEPFVYTHAAQLMVAKYDPGLYPVDVSRHRDAIPERVVYLSLGTDGKHVLHNRRAEGVRADHLLNTLQHWNVYVYSNDQGFDTYRTMRVGSFGGALDREEQAVFATFVGGAGFRVKSTKKLGPSNR